MQTMLRQERIKRGWTIQYIAEQIGKTPETVRLLETGKRKPSYDVLVKLLDLFGCSDPRKLFALNT